MPKLSEIILTLDSLTQTPPLPPGMVFDDSGNRQCGTEDKGDPTENNKTIYIFRDKVVYSLQQLGELYPGTQREVWEKAKKNMYMATIR